jgi:hypothetical protein
MSSTIPPGIWLDPGDYGRPLDEYDTVHYAQILSLFDPTISACYPHISQTAPATIMTVGDQVKYIASDGQPYVTRLDMKSQQVLSRMLAEGMPLSSTLPQARAAYIDYATKAADVETAWAEVLSKLQTMSDAEWARNRTTTRAPHPMTTELWECTHGAYMLAERDDYFSVTNSRIHQVFLRFRSKGAEVA